MDIIKDKFYGLFVGDLVGKGTQSHIVAPETRSHVHNCNILVELGWVTLMYYNDFQELLLQIHNRSLNAYKCLLCADSAKLFAAMLDYALHGRSKKEILSVGAYRNLQLSVELWGLLTVSPIDDNIDMLIGDNNPINALRLVMYCFRTTNNFNEGLELVRENSLKPQITGRLYGQLAGAYYGLTDIDEDAIRSLEETDYSVVEAAIDRLKT